MHFRLQVSKTKFYEGAKTVSFHIIWTTAKHNKWRKLFKSVFWPFWLFYEKKALKVKNIIFKQAKNRGKWSTQFYCHRQPKQSSFLSSNFQSIISNRLHQMAFLNAQSLTLSNSASSTDQNRPTHEH